VRATAALLLLCACARQPVDGAPDLAVPDLVVADRALAPPDLAPPDMRPPCACASDTDCHDPSYPRCDVANCRCVVCLPENDNCPPGRVCLQINAEYSCSCGCKVDAECPGKPIICCYGCYCSDVSTDHDNCGVCGRVCGLQQACIAGSCT
jgi:hypothetical protein